MRLKTSDIALLIILVFTIIGSSCKKVRVQTVGGTLKFSVDTLKFDTVFTAAGSFTTGLLIYNPQNEEVVISSVFLNENTNSFFHLNVDGFPVNGGSAATNLKIAAHDSLYVYATVNINPNIKTNAFLVTDSLVVTMNGKNFYLPFTAYGQNAHYIVDSALASSATWPNDLPYVIIWNGDTTRPKGLQINPGATLTLSAGCRVYMHQNAGISVFGTLTSIGTKTDSIIFQGDRLDRAYFGYMGYPGEWGGFYFDSKSSGSKLTNTIIENCGNGALGIPAAIWVAQDSTGSTQVTMNNCVIQNSYGYGIYSFGGNVVATNCLINTTGQQALAILLGGNASFTNCTFANYGTAALSHASSGTVAITDYFWDGVTGDPVYYAALNAVLHNCIVYGSLDSEVTFDTTGSPPGTNASLNMDHCLLRIGSVREPFVQFNSCIFNQDPLFKNSANGDFHITAGSPAAGTGSGTMPSSNLDGQPWFGGAIDIGCY